MKGKLFLVFLTIAAACHGSISFASAAEVMLSPAAGGRYLPTGPNVNPGFNETGLFLVSVGQGQAGWLSFDISQLSGVQVCDLTLRFTQVGTTNPNYFPLTIQLYDVSTSFDRLSLSRNPLDAEGEQIAADLHSGGVYASLQVLASGEGASHDFVLIELAIADFQMAIDNGEQFFSIGIANISFDAVGYFAPQNASLTVSTGCVNEVEIDIKPGSKHNFLNPKSKEVIPVAILTTTTFDARTVAPSSVKFGPNGAKAIHKKGHRQDVDRDGDLDMVFHFKTQQTGIRCGDTEATLTGATFGGQAITGTDAIQTVGCRPHHLQKDADAEEAGIPEEYTLFQNHPNPFNPATEIRFQLPEANHIVVRIFNILGEEIRTLVNQPYQPGSHSVRWDGRDEHGNQVASGIYLYQLQAGDFSQIRKMSLLR
jgi:hypothetical protein